MSLPSVTSYDEVPYPVYVFPQAHPDRLASIATLLSLNPPDVERCRVLELGCATGVNLISMAFQLPRATFVGIDLSQRQIADGKKWIDELGLTNIELRHQSILDLEPGAETFDYLFCHGVFSWVPPAVQERILDLCRYSLHAEGIAFISYNTLPGWHIRGTIRDMMRFHGMRFSQPLQQVAEARALLDFLVASVKEKQNPYGQFLRSELEFLRNQPDAYLFHDHLEEHNTPLYFHEFVERAVSHGLRYLSDAELTTMESANFPPEVNEVLGRIGTDLIRLEQYMDFLRNRSFRQSLLCHAHQEPIYQLPPSNLKRFLIGSPVWPKSANPDLYSTVHEQFEAPSGASASPCIPIVKMALKNPVGGMAARRAIFGAVPPGALSGSRAEWMLGRRPSPRMNI